MHRSLKYSRLGFNKLYRHKNKIGFAILILSFIISLITFIVPWIQHTLGGPEQEISTEVCTTLKKSQISYTTGSGKTLNVDTKLLNKGYLLIKNSGKRELNSVSTVVSFDSAQKLSIVYVDTYGSSAGIIQNIDKPKLDLQENRITFSLNYINSGEQIVMAFGLDRPADAYVEVRGMGLTKQQNNIPGCDNFKDLQSAQEGRLFGAKGLSYVSPECIKKNDELLSCTLTSTSDTFSVPGDVKPGSTLQENDNVEQDDDPLAN